MKKFRIFPLIVIALLTSNILFAGSSQIKASFYEAYQFDETVQYAETMNILDGKIAFYLMDENVLIGEKVAVINALQWNEKSKSNVDTYKMFLGRQYGVGFENFDINILKGDEVLCLGYLMLRDENMALNETVEVLKVAVEKNSGSYITNLIHAIASAEVLLNNGSKCEAWTICDSVRNNTSLKKDINDQAIGLIFQEIDPFKSACK